MPFAGVVVSEVDGGVDGEAAGVEPAGVGTWPFGKEEEEDVLLLGEGVGLPAEGRPRLIVLLLVDDTQLRTKGEAQTGARRRR
jgi:hypothetical protein